MFCEDLDFADDLPLLSRTMQQVQKSLPGHQYSRGGGGEWAAGGGREGGGERGE